MKNAVCRLLISALALVLFASCTPKKDSSYSKDPLDIAVQKLDQGDADGAISDLEDLRTHDSRPLVTETLASAYAARAGIRVDTYWGFLVGFRAPLVNLEQARLSPSAAQLSNILLQLRGKVDADDTSAIGKVRDMLGTMELWQERIDALPVVSPANESDLLTAIRVLQSHPTAGGRLYRALLGLIELKTLLDRGFSGWSDVANQLSTFDVRHLGSDHNKQILCYRGVQDFEAWADNLLLRMKDIATDVAVAYPSKSDEIYTAIDNTQTISATLEKGKQGPCL